MLETETGEVGGSGLKLSLCVAVLWMWTEFNFVSIILVEMAAMPSGFPNGQSPTQELGVLRFWGIHE